jgi:hypothetical protein
MTSLIFAVLERPELGLVSPADVVGRGEFTSMGVGAMLGCYMSNTFYMCVAIVPGNGQSHLI